MKTYRLLAGLLLGAGLFISCSNDDGNSSGPEEIPDKIGNLNDKILVNNLTYRQEGLVLVNDPGNDRAYLLDKETGEAAFEWALPFPLGNDAKLLDDGRLLACLGVSDPAFNFGGYGGKIHLIEPDGTSSWSYEYASPDYIAHHDAQMLPNGNILFMSWERIPLEEASAMGYAGQFDNIYIEAILEIDPQTNEIVWRWDVKDHLVQDVDDSKANYGVVAKSPHRVDINYKDEKSTANLDNGDLMHANALTYDAERDVIYLSVNYYSEVWVIDHSTTTAQARGSEGGNYGKGGDLLYRFGNPEAYDNVAGTRRFYNNHSPNLVPDTRNMLIFMNNNNPKGPSVVYELELPEVFQLDPDADNEPAVVWEYSHADLYSPKVSSATRLPNGNTLIGVGTFGYWEVTPDKKIVWQFKDQGFFWRGYHVDTQHALMKQL